MSRLCQTQAGGAAQHGRGEDSRFGSRAAGAYYAGVDRRGRGFDRSRIAR